MNFAIADDDCALFGRDEKGNEMYFLDYISKRVAKTELERRYCDRYLRGFATFDCIRVNIELLKEDHEWDAIHFELREDGYPSAVDLDDFRKSVINGEKIAKKYKDHCGDDGDSP